MAGRKKRLAISTWAAGLVLCMAAVLAANAQALGPDSAGESDRARDCTTERNSPTRDLQSSDTSSGAAYSRDE